MTTVSVPSAAPVLAPPPAALRLLSDERLARWAARGSEAAFAVIFERHHQALHRYCHSIVGNGHDAADALQNTMLKALRALPGETRTIALKAWLYRIAHNESVSLLRARRPDSDLDAAAHVGDPRSENVAESRERLRDLTADLGELTEKQRGALLMRELGGLEFGDVAGALQVTPSAAKQSVYEARCALQSLQEGRAMDCDLVRRTVSDGDRRTLRGIKLRAHLRACAGCRDFEHALHQRPAQLAALAPPLPLAMGAAILHGLLGAGTGHGGGGGLLAAVGIGGASLGTKVATVAVVASTIAGGAAITVPALDAPAPDRTAAPAPSAAAVATAPQLSRGYAPTREADAALVRAAKAKAQTAISAGARGAWAATAGLSRAQLQRTASAPPAIAARERAQTAATAKRAAARDHQTTAARRDRTAARHDRATERPQTQTPAPVAATTAPTTPRAPTTPTPPVAPGVAAPVTGAADGSAAGAGDAVAPSRPR